MDIQIVTAPFPADLASRARIAVAEANISRSELIRRAVLARRGDA